MVARQESDGLTLHPAALWTVIRCKPRRLTAAALTQTIAHGRGSYPSMVTESGPYGNPPGELAASYRWDDFQGFYRHPELVSGADL